MLPPGWRIRFQTPTARKMLLVTINLDGGDAVTPYPHLACHPHSILLAFDVHAHVDAGGGRTLHFLPLLQQWPTLRRTLARQDRRVEIAETQVEVIAESGLAAQLLAAGSAQRATVRIDLWSPGIPLSRVIPRFAGRVTSASIGTQRGPISLTLTDGDPDRTVTYPNLSVTREEFPDAPDSSVDADQQVILGRALGMTAIQIDRAGLLHLAGMPPVQVDRVYKRGNELVTGWSAIELRTATNGIPYTAVRLDKPLEDIVPGGDMPYLTVDVRGLSEEGIIPLLARVGGFELSPRARAILPTLENDFPMDIEVSSPANVLDLLRGRFLPQTDYALFLHRNQLDLIPLTGPAPELSLGVGKGLLYRLAEQGADTPMDSVFNAFEIRCGRDRRSPIPGDPSAPLFRLPRDAVNGSSAVRRLLEHSEKRPWGRRWLAVDALDLAVDTDDAGNVIGSPGGERLAESMALLHALPHRSHGYLAEWEIGYSLDLNWRVWLTDDDEGLANVATRVTEIVETPNGPEITLQTEDAA